MFESLFGAEMPLAVRFFVAFLIVLGVIGAIWWTYAGSAAVGLAPVRAGDSLASG